MMTGLLAVPVALSVSSLYLAEQSVEKNKSKSREMQSVEGTRHE